MFGKSHKVVTRRAIKILQEMLRGTVVLSETRHKEDIIAECADTDYFNDLEFVDVDCARDDPHDEELFADVARYETIGLVFTAFNHFMDLKKGAGVFDDYDGYSYYRGSAHSEQHQDADEVAPWYVWPVALASGMKVDEAINWYLNDEYVHAPCHQWYLGCSPAVERYSYYTDMGHYATKDEELAARFPLETTARGQRRGIPFSVFMPLDNLARYWYEELRRTRRPKLLGPVLHAIQDACIPHHAAGYMGNWHSQYEDKLDGDEVIKEWVEKDKNFEKDVMVLAEKWNISDPNPPTRLELDDWKKSPARNWRIDLLVTWVALNAYREYANTYQHFVNGFTFNEQSMKGLTKQAEAMSVLVLIKAIEEADLFFIGNRKTREFHYPYCPWVGLMAEQSKNRLLTREAAITDGYNGCYHCLRRYDTG